MIEPTNNNSKLSIQLIIEKMILLSGMDDRKIRRMKRLAGMKWALRTDTDQSLIKVNSSRYGDLEVTCLN